MTFGSPHWLWALLLVPVLAGLFMQNIRRGKKLLQKFIAPRLVPRLAASVSGTKRWIRFLLQLAAFACVVTALARPRHGFTWQEEKRRGRDILLAIDVSKSMLATDITPNRLTRAKLAAQDLTGLLQGDRVGVIAFAGDAFLQAPLTADSGAVLDSIRELDPSVIPVGGTNIADAIKVAVDAFGKGESDNRALVIFSDGEEIDADGIASARNSAESVRIFTVGIGTNNGSLIPLPAEPGEASFVKDEHGQFVKSRLDENRLRKLAEVGGGIYVHLENGSADMRKIVDEGLKKMNEHEINAKLSRHPIERYRWPLCLGVALLASSLLVNERRRTPGRTARKMTGRSAPAVAVVFLALTLSASAGNPGMELYGQQRYREAGEAFQKELARRGDSAASHYNLGASAYKSGDYDKALDAFSKALAGADPKLQPKAEYNLGNTLYQRGTGKQEKAAKLTEWRGAIEHYEQALKLEPQNGDAKFNRDLVQKKIEELEKEQQEQKKEQQDKDDKQKQQDQKQDQKQQQNGGQSQQKQDKDDGQKQQNQDQKKNDGKNSQQSQQDQKDGKNQEQKSQDGKGEKQDSQQQSGKNEKGEKKEEDGSSQKPQQFGDKSQQGRQQSPGDKPNPESAPPPSDKKFSGEVSAAQPQDQPGSEPEQQAEAAEGEVKEGEMSKGQALSLLESAKSEDERVNLTERKRATRVGKDW